MNAFGDGVGVMWFELGDMEYRVDATELIGKTEGIGLLSRLGYDVEWA